jgi:hypothetical protein
MRVYILMELEQCSFSRELVVLTFLTRLFLGPAADAMVIASSDVPGLSYPGRPPVWSRHHCEKSSNNQRLAGAG